MPLDPQAKALLEERAAQRTQAGGPTEQAGRRRAANPTGPIVARTDNRKIPARGGPLPIRIYTPLGQPPFPVVVYIHGGAFIGGGIEEVDGNCRFLSTDVGATVISVGYRLAPGAKFPGPLEDCIDAVQWVSQNIHLWGGDPTRLAVAGASAGGNLAAAVCLQARDAGGPKITHQVLFCPVISTAMDTSSYQEYGSGAYGLSTAAMTNAWNQYLSGPQDREHPYANLLQTKDLHGLPRTLIITAECDPLRNEGNLYAERLKAAGVPVVNTCYPGMIHGFYNRWDIIDKGKAANAQAAEELGKAFSG